MKNFDVYLTRDTYTFGIKVWKNIQVGITKWRGCCFYASGKSNINPNLTGSKFISQDKCRIKYKFVPQQGTAYNVYTKNDKIIKKKIDIAYSG